MLAVQGPRSVEVIERLGLPTDHGYMSFADATFDGSPVVVCRSGYTGERGFELVPLWDAAGALWDARAGGGADLGIRPCGLGARDTLRTEMGYPLHGHELSLDITPVQARAGWAVGWKKPAFWGRDALLAEKEAGPARVLRGLVGLERGIPRADMRVLDAADRADRCRDERDVLAHPTGRHRAGAARPVGGGWRPRCSSTCVAGLSGSR